MNFLKKILKEADMLLFYVYIWQIPFAWRFIVEPNRGTGSTFNEYMDISLYIGEGVLLLAYLFKRHKKEEKSIIIKDIVRNLFHVKQLVFLAIINLVLLNVLLSIDPILSLVSGIHLSFIILACYMLYEYFVSRGTKVLIEVGYILLASLTFQLLVSGLQVYTGHSVGLSWLSESAISIDKLGIAKSIIFGETILRAYGTFSHPNVLAAYALFVLVYFFFLSKLFHMEQRLLSISIIISLLSVILAQSKLSMFFILVFLIFEAKNLFHVELSKKNAKVIILLLIGIVLGLFHTDIEKSFSTRLDQVTLQHKYESISLIGSGIGTYRLSYDSINVMGEWWLLEPVHNILYILLREIGVLGFAILIFSIVWVLKVVPRETLKETRYLLLFILYTMFTDHHGWDIYQGQQILGLVTTLCIISINILTKSNKISIKYFRNNTETQDMVVDRFK